MARGQPDWQVPDYDLSGVQVDVADTADRILGFSRSDTRGRVHYLDTFSDGIDGYILGITGAAATPVPKVATRYGGPGPVHIELDAGDVLSDVSTMQRKFWLGSAKRLGIELCVTFDQDSGDFDTTLSFDRVGGNADAAILRWSRAARQWQVWNATAFVSVVGGPDVSTDPMFFLTVKLVYDYEAGIYKRLLLGEIQYSLESIGIGVGPDAETGGAYVQLVSRSAGAGKGVARVHYLIFTKDEP